MEVCVDNVSSVKSALEGGASRIELCSALSEGGLTPSLGLLRAALRMATERGNSCKVLAIIRPRGGDFLYSDEEVEVMCEDAKEMVAAGADGIVVGCLDTEGNVDEDACRRVLQAVQGHDRQIDKVFHRAFDLCNDGEAALLVIEKLGFRRLLTSGQQATASEGASFIKKLVDLKTNVDIMPGGGINPSNLGEILQATGCTTAHASARVVTPSPMHYKRQGCKMGTNSSEFDLWVTCAKTVRNLVDLLNTHNNKLK